MGGNRLAVSTMFGARFGPSDWAEMRTGLERRRNKAVRLFDVSLSWGLTFKSASATLTSARMANIVRTSRPRSCARSC